MQINDITNYLYSNEASKLLAQSVSSSSTPQSTSETASGSSEFSSLLSDEIKNLTEFSELTSVLGGSVLGNITDASSLQTLSEDLMGTGSGREVIAKLAEGHLNSIVFDDSEDDDSDTLTETLSSSYADAVSNTSTVETVLEEVLETLNSQNVK